MDCRMAVRFMHEYLDRELARDRLAELETHLRGCPVCRNRLEVLTGTEALIRSACAGRDAFPPADLPDRILRSLPAPTRPRKWARWVRRHPAVTAACFFALVMMGSWLATWNQDDRLRVEAGPDADRLVIEGNTVIVPAGQKVSGDLVVANGTVRVDGEVEGNITVIDGHVLLASSAQIAGEIHEIDRAVDWLFFRINAWLNDLMGSR